MNIENEIEFWKDIPTYEGLYQASSLGNIKSLNYRRTGKEKLLKASLHKSGYLIASISKNNKTRNISVHVLVAMAFKGHVPDGHKIVVDHNDNNKLNNRADNLRLTTHRDNCTKDLKESVSKYIGVCFDKRRNKWYSHIKYNERNIYLGYFDLEIDAHYAYQKALKELEQGLDLNILYPKHIKTSQYIGVFWNNRDSKWQSIIKYKNRQILLGSFELEIDAENAYKKALEEFNQGLDLNLIYPKNRNQSSKYFGVMWNKRRNKWMAIYKGKYLGLYNTELEAHEAVQRYIAKLAIS